ncbi:MAG: acyltransferase [Scytolyngbya sp. HA4215-MV1]|jgi:peptidoglycan/LPS O-acetylase OafA/YrhL|nr:acyltransferase [Scytolyngbya sp. HA4215-MV1]
MKSIVPRPQISPRDIRFDILKVIGLLCIILAHSDPPIVIDQLRNFDVPLMVIISGTLFYLTTGNKQFFLWDYLRKRVPRLVAPVWLFLAFFFTAIYLLCQATGQTYPYLSDASSNPILSSFLFRGGLGYVYIIRVFLITAILSPLILKLYRSLKRESYFLGVLAISYIAYEIALKLLGDGGLSPPWFAIFVKQYLMLCVPYGCLVGLGMVLTRLSQQFLSTIVLASFTIFLAMFAHFFWLAKQLGKPAAELVQTQIYKYPPTIYYLSYAIFASLLLYLVIDYCMKRYGSRVMEHKSWVDNLVFVSASSLWVYLWHIFWLITWRLVVQPHIPLTQNFVMTFGVIAFLAIATTYLQKWLVTQLIRTTEIGHSQSDLLTILLLK